MNFAFAAITSYGRFERRSDGVFAPVEKVALNRPIRDILADRGIHPSQSVLTRIADGGYETDDWLVQLIENEEDSPHEHELTPELLLRRNKQSRGKI